MKILNWLFRKDDVYRKFNCITTDSDGEVRFTEGRKYKSGTVIIRAISGWMRANPDGTFPVGYMSNWEEI